MMIQRPLLFFLVLSVLGVGVTCRAQVQPRDSTSVFLAVPPSERESLTSAFYQFIAIQVAGDWEKVYVRLDNKSNISKDKFTEQMHSNMLLQFVPQSVTFIPPQEAWMITGCGVFRNANTGEREGKVSSVYARKVKDDWRLTPVAILLVKDEPNSVRPCKAQ